MTPHVVCECSIICAYEWPGQRFHTYHSRGHATEVENSTFGEKKKYLPSNFLLPLFGTYLPTSFVCVYHIDMCARSYLG